MFSRRSLRYVAIVLVGISTRGETATPLEKLLKKPDAWFASDEGRETLNCVLSWQTKFGDWPKNTDTTQPFSGDPSRLKGTFDNKATTNELRLLARAFGVIGDARLKRAFLKGFDHIIDAQYANGGWPQYFPLSKKYPRRITFNDGSMTRLMIFLQETTSQSNYAFLDALRKQQAQDAVQRGIACILKCQIKRNGELTVWCAQHHEVDLSPAKARSYELPSLSGAESAGILLFLMSLDEPNADVVAAVKAGVAWFQKSRIDGVRFRLSRTEPNLIRDDTSGPLWARFYDLKTNRPFFCDRDGIPKFDIMHIGWERRSGYAWYGNWGEKVARTYAKWEYQ